MFDTTCLLINAVSAAMLTGSGEAALRTRKAKEQAMITKRTTIRNKKEKAKMLVSKTDVITCRSRRT